MLIPVPPQFRRSRRAKRAAAAPPPLGLTITAVRAAGFATRVYFSAPIVWNGVDVPSAFKAFTSDGFMDSCINVVATGPDFIDVEFNGSVAVGAAWEVVGAMAGISPAVAWPQAGTVNP